MILLGQDNLAMQSIHARRYNFQPLTSFPLPRNPLSLSAFVMFRRQCHG